MDRPVVTRPDSSVARPGNPLSVQVPILVAFFAFLLLYWPALQTLAIDFGRDPDVGGGILLLGVAVLLATDRGMVVSRPAPVVGAMLLGAAVALRIASELAVDRYTLRISLIVALLGILVLYWGPKQILHWRLPILLAVLSLPLPNGVWAGLAYPLQLASAQLAQAMFVWRDVPVELADTVILLPGYALIVTEGCSGLRSVMTFAPLALIAGTFWLRSRAGRTLLLAAVVPLALCWNGIRIFMTGFLVLFVDGSFGEGIRHQMLGWLTYMAVLVTGALLLMALTRLEQGRAEFAAE